MPIVTISTFENPPHEFDAAKSTSFTGAAGTVEPQQSYSQDLAILGRLDRFAEKLAKIEFALAALVQQVAVKDWYTTAEVADVLKKAEYTVREWCRQGRIKARKKPCGRGKGGEWLVSHEELTRVKNEGLLPFSRGD